MKKNLPITNRENNYSADQRIVSCTDLKGITTYVNDDFISIAGFSEDELIGKNHNVVRHPDMPPAAYADLWSTIKQGKPWMGIVKNRCKNGDHYWVDAFITPITERGQVTGYQSVRVKPDRKHVDAAAALYKQLWGESPSLVSKLKALKPGMLGQLMLANLASLLAGFGLYMLAGSTWVAALMGLSAALVVGLIAAKLIAAPWQRAAAEAASIFKNAVAQQVYTGRNDELGQLMLTIKMLSSQQETVVWRLGDAAANLEKSALHSVELSRNTNQQMNQQTAEIDMVATAMNEMTATVQDVAQNASMTADATRSADNEVLAGKSVVNDSIASINQLAARVQEAVGVIAKLARDSEQIGSVVEVIRGIAEQTNLLALNAAIEAARAGEQGRGFAVVADEVRTLASRTQSSTDEIQAMIQELQDAAGQAVGVMEQGQKVAENSVDHAQRAGESLESITRAVETIMQMTTQIATAAEEQSAVAEEINRNIVNISNVAAETQSASAVSMSNSEIVETEIRKLYELVKQFGKS